MNTLFIVPTPIGNLEDMTLRGLRILGEVSLIAAEDTRTSRILLQHYNIQTPLTNYHEHNKLNKLETILDALAKDDVALISDAGTPGISDPGYELIQAAIQHGFRVEPLPGANAIIPALIGSGLPTNSFLFIGFLPKKRSARQTLLESLHDESCTLIAYESPNRLVDTLQLILDIFGNRPVCVARELSKKFETFYRGNLADVLASFQATPPRGEITLLIGAASTQEDTKWDADRVHASLYDLLEAGESLSNAAKLIASQSGWKKRDVYALGLES